MHTTTNISLKKPDGADSVKLQDFNDNADIIDTQFVLQQAAIDTSYQQAIEYTDSVAGAFNSNFRVSVYNGSNAVNGINGISTYVSGYGLKTGSIKQINLITIVPNVPAATLHIIGYIQNPTLYPTHTIQKDTIFRDEMNNSVCHGLLSISQEGAIGIKADCGMGNTTLNITETYL